MSSCSKKVPQNFLKLSNVISLGIFNCSICANEGVDDIPAEFYCDTCQQHLCLRDSRIHSKQNPQHVVKKLNHPLNSQQQTVTSPSPTLSLPSSQCCQLNQCPINTFCKTCRQIITSMFE